MPGGSAHILQRIMLHLIYENGLRRLSVQVGCHPDVTPKSEKAAAGVVISGAVDKNDHNSAEERSPSLPLVVSGALSLTPQ